MDAALAAGADIVLRIDVQGAATVRALMPEAVTIFLTADSEAELVGRLAARKTETLDKLLVRVAAARAELARLREFDYVVVNAAGQLDRCAAQIGAIIDAEKLRIRKPPAAGAGGAGGASGGGGAQ